MGSLIPLYSAGIPDKEDRIDNIKKKSADYFIEMGY